MEINGREIAQKILDELKHRVENLKTKQIVPTLAVIRVGDDPAVTSYVNQKEKTAERIGVKVFVFQYPSTVTEQELIAKIQELDANPDIHGIILQLPIPQTLDEQALLNEISPTKDVDGFHSETKFIVPVAEAVETIIKHIFTISNPLQEVTFEEWLKHQHIAVIGKGKTGGQPVIDLLHSKHMTPMIIDSKTEHPEDQTKQADIIISAVGRPNIISKDMIKPGSILISIGMDKNEEGKFYGDYEVSDIQDIAGFYTPVPGGIGPVNVAKLMENIVLAAERTLQ